MEQRCRVAPNCRKEVVRGKIVLCPCSLFGARAKIKLKASDGHELSAYVAKPAGAAIGALVLVQEIYGVNAHIRSVADGYAKDGFQVIVPALPGIITYGRTIEEAREMAHDAIVCHLQGLLKDDEEIPLPRSGSRI